MILSIPTIHRIFKSCREKINKNNFLSFWPYLNLRAVLVLEKIYKKFYFEKFKNQKKYPDVWFGFRVGIYAYFVKKNFYTINKNLTFISLTVNLKNINFSVLIGLEED